MGSPVIQKCACCCPQPEGQCCLHDFYTQAVISISGVADPPGIIPEFKGCSCVNVSVVVDLPLDGPGQSVTFSPPCDELGGRQGILFFRNYRIRAGYGAPMWCEAVTSAGDVFRIHAIGPADPLAVQIELQSEFNQNVWNAQGGYNVVRSGNNVSSVLRAMCAGGSRPFESCNDYVSDALEQFEGLPVALGISGSLCDATNATVSLVLQ